MIVLLQVAGQPCEKEVKIPSSEQPDPVLRASRAAQRAYTETVIRIVRARREDPATATVPIGLVSVVGVYCCRTCANDPNVPSMQYQVRTATRP